MTQASSAPLCRADGGRASKLVTRMVGNQTFVAPQTVAELRFGALVAGWGEFRRRRLEQAIAATTVVPITDELLTGVTRLRYNCRQRGHALANKAHVNDLWIAACAIETDLALLSADSIFHDVPGLTLV